MILNGWKNGLKMPQINPEIILHAYMKGIFPMADSADAEELYWYDPERRGILPLEDFHLPRRLARTVRQRRYEVTHDVSFDEIMGLCAMPDTGDKSRENTWINREIREVYGKLHRLGYGHSIEVREKVDSGYGEIIGGLYGLSIGGAFFGESMFSKKRDASKIALVYLVARLLKGGFRLLDTQFITDHLKQFGAVEIAREQYHGILENALSQKEANFYCGSDEEVLEAFLLK